MFSRARDCSCDNCRVGDPAYRVMELRAEYGGPELAVAHLLCDRHAAEAVAVTLVGPDLSAVDLTFGELRERSERLAAGLAGLGVGAGSRVAALLPKSVELPVVLLAIWRLGAVYVPLFTAFAPQAIALRLLSSGTRVVIADAGQRPKLDPGEDMPAEPPWTVVTVGAREPAAGDVRYEDLAATGRHVAAPVVVGAVPGLEVAGAIRELGGGVDGFTVGEAVVTVTGTGAEGGYASISVVDARFVVSLASSGVDSALVVAAVANAATAYLALTRVAHLHSGETVLVHGALGGLASTFPGVARSLGASTVVGTVRPASLATAEAAGLPYDRVIASNEFPARCGSQR